jgi:hypothetical protein
LIGFGASSRRQHPCANKNAIVNNIVIDIAADALVYIITNQLTMVPNNLTACNSPVGAKFLSIHWYNFALATAPTTAVGFL